MSKKLLAAVAAIMTMGALAIPAMASAAPVWKVNGTTVTANTAVNTAGTLTLKASNGATVTCDVRDTGTIGAGGVDSITNIKFINCTSNTGCPTVGTIPTAGSLPWGSQLSYSGTDVIDTISGVSVDVTIGGAPGCPGTLRFTGTMTPKVVNGAYLGGTLGLIQNTVWDNDASTQCGVDTADAQFDGTAASGTLTGPAGSGLTAVISGDDGVWTTGCGVVSAS